jgi:hypothetical protein
MTMPNKDSAKLREQFEKLEITGLPLSRIMGSFELIEQIIDVVEAHTAARVAATLEQAKDFGSWVTGKCDLHKKYTAACCGCQRESAKSALLEDYQAYIDKLAHLTTGQKGQE